MLAYRTRSTSTRCTVCGAPLPCIVIESAVIPVSLPSTSDEFIRVTVTFLPSTRIRTNSSQDRFTSLAAEQNDDALIHTRMNGITRIRFIGTPPPCPEG